MTISTTIDTQLMNIKVMLSNMSLTAKLVGALVLHFAYFGQTFLGLVIASLIITLPALYKWFWPPPLPTAGDLYVEEYISHSSKPPEEEAEGPRPPAPVKGPRCERYAVMEAKAKLGYLEESKANRLVADRVLRACMTDMGMRPSHIAWHAPLALELFFVPTDRELLAHQARHAMLKRERQSLLQQEPGK